MKNYLAPGNMIPFVAGADISSGDGLMVGSLFGVAAGDVAQGESGLAQTTGVFTLPKPGSQAWSIGQKVYWDGTAKLATTAAGGNTLIGTAYEAVGSGAGETTGAVRLTVIPAEPGAGVVAGFTLTPAAGGSNVSEVTVQAIDANGAAIDYPVNFDLWLSDSDKGVGLTATAASGTVQAKSNSGTVLVAMTAKKALRVQSLADGSFVLEITDTGKTGFHVCAQVPGTGRPVVSDKLVADDYG